ncbi:MAG: FHA domain-containing protein [Planctomycetaceae bacterium]|jgi:hypothetical protein|nr:FHA domain-containing protein [Planctomycetaceae bacterium]
MGDKITISFEETQNSSIDVKIKEQEVLQRTQQHQQQIHQQFQQQTFVDGRNNTPINAQNNFDFNFIYKSWVYLALFGLGFGLIAWIGTEIVWQSREEVIKEIIQQNRGITEEDEGTLAILYFLWYMTNLSIIAIGLSIADNIMERNYSKIISHGMLGFIIGGIAGIPCCIATELLYNALGGGSEAGSFIAQMIARALGWGLMGCFIAIAPGILMKNGKKFGLGVLGGAVGGLLGGLLFDPICYVTGSDGLARFIGIVSFGAIAGVAMGILEEAAKQGWLRVTAGLIKGKQFIIYKNPTVIGSSPKSEIYLFKDTTVMPQHAEIRQQGSNFAITAISPQGIILVNGHPVMQKNLLNGDFIGIGNTQFMFGTKDIQQQF